MPCNEPRRVKTECPHCTKPLTAGADYVSHIVSCSHCNKTFKIPDNSEGTTKASPTDRNESPQNVWAEEHCLKVSLILSNVLAFLLGAFGAAEGRQQNSVTCAALAGGAGLLVYLCLVRPKPEGSELATTLVCGFFLFSLISGVGLVAGGFVWAAFTGSPTSNYFRIDTN